MWSTWLTEYDHAATEAETNKVLELEDLDSVKRNFQKAVVNVASVWEASFQQNGGKDAAVSRKQMVKLFRDHMLFHHPNRSKQKGAFVAGEPFLADSGESTQATGRDAPSVEERAPSKKGEKTRAKRTIGNRTISKQPPMRKDGPAAAGGLTCPACELHHELRDCFYAFPEKAPEWFKPRHQVATLIRFRLENDLELQESLRSIKRPRTQTPKFKLSHTPTPARITEADDE